MKAICKLLAGCSALAITLHGNACLGSPSLVSTLASAGSLIGQAEADSPRREADRWLREARRALDAGNADEAERLVFDAVGRGPLAGPVVSAAVILPENVCIDGLDDSKALKAEERERLYDEILDVSVAWAIGAVPAAEIDSINIYQAIQGTNSRRDETNTRLGSLENRVERLEDRIGEMGRQMGEMGHQVGELARRQTT